MSKISGLVGRKIIVAVALVVMMVGAGAYALAVDGKSSATPATKKVMTMQGSPTIQYRAYDMFMEPWGEWWQARLSYYGEALVITNEPGNNTVLYLSPAMAGQGIIYAPYRFSIDARNQTGLSVDRPEFMPVLGPTVPGADANIDIYFQYIYQTWWDAYWKPTWNSEPGWVGDDWYPGANDGYYMGTTYNVTMNRAAAEEWLNMPQTADPLTWWAANKAAYTTAWNDWILDEGNNRLDIFCAYDYVYMALGTYMSLAVESDGNVTLRIDHLSWGYEALMTRWLREVDICAHEPWWEDFTLAARYSKYAANVTMDAVAQYSLHAVKANGTADGAAWVWEAVKMDYIIKVGHPSDFKPYAPRRYQSWNTGDTLLGTPVTYETTPGWFNLSAGDKLIFKLPTSATIGYKGVGLTATDYDDLYAGDPSGFTGIRADGMMSLGYFVTGWPPGTGLDLVPLYDDANKTLTITGPVDFNNFWHTATGVLYHGAPWIEFNVTLTIPITATAPQGTSTSGPVASSSISELLVLAVVVSAAILAVTALGASARRRI